MPTLTTTDLEHDLKSSIEGEVRFDDGTRALYATDASNYRQVPIGVVIPRTEQDIVKTVELCRKFGAPILSRGGGTSLAGQGCNVAVIMDMSKVLNRILKIDAAGHEAVVQPGLILDHLRDEAEKVGLTFGPDPATHSRCTLGGMIGNNSCGVHALMAGKTVDNVLSLDILTYDGLRLTVGPTSPDELEEIIQAGGRRGEIYAKLKSLRDRYEPLIRKHYPKIPRRVSGYNLDELLPENGFNVARALVGTEGTCVTVLQARLKLIANPAARSLLVMGFGDVYQAADIVPALLEHRPIGLEGMDDGMVGNLSRYQGFAARIARLPPGNAWLLMEFGADSKAEAEAKAEAVIKQLGSSPSAPTMKLLRDPHEVEDVWMVRESALAATAFIPGQRDRLEGWEDSAVPPARLGAYLRDLRALYNRHGYQGAFYGHFGEGCLHTRIDFDQDTPEGRASWLKFMDEAADLVVSYGGSLSGEHGDGQARGPLLVKMYGPELVDAFREFKRIWDPEWKMNPGKVIDSAGILDHLRLADNYRPAKPETHFQFPDDSGSFARAAVRCVGVGKCRRTDGGLMCPSFMVTREEKDSTRGRAHLLFEMLQGGVLKDGWRNESVKEALDLCLACKGCKNDCPTNVDMATYKAEFLSHYYEGRVRPRAAYAFGLVYWAARAASVWPSAVNALLKLPGLRGLAKVASGMHADRDIPALATETFRDWFRSRRAPSTPSTGKRVILWPDTFTNFFHPEIGKAAVEVLEYFGHQVSLPPEMLCCGRPLYDYGWLDRAKILLKDTLVALHDPIQKGVPIIGLEPSCVAVFRDELCNLYPSDPDAQRLKKQTFLLSEFLVDATFPSTLKGREALVQVHCHHQSVLGVKDELHVLKQLGLNVSRPESGCCGMAGGFGFEKEHHDLSMQVGERALLPAVRAASLETLVIANGFSCHEQIRQGTGRRTLHLAEVLRLACVPGSSAS